MSNGEMCETYWLASVNCMVLGYGKTAVPTPFFIYRDGWQSRGKEEVLHLPQSRRYGPSSSKPLWTAQCLGKSRQAVLRV